MADDQDYDDMDEEEETPEVPGIDYDELDPDTGFKKVELQIWRAYEEEVLKKPEDERDDPEDWAGTYAEGEGDENAPPRPALDKNVVSTVVKLGIYAGSRDEFNQRTGEGKAIYDNGDIYEGQYWEGKKNGTGKYVYASVDYSPSQPCEADKLLRLLVKSRPADETDEQFVKRACKQLEIGERIVQTGLQFGFAPCYSGCYVNNLRHGQGVMKNKDATVYEGMWKDNKRHGEGKYYYLNGDTYAGEWADGLKHGSGTYTFAHGKGEYSGVWDKGIFTQGAWRMTDGNVYEGNFDNKNRPCDPTGAIKFPKINMVQTGNYLKGKWAPTDELIVTAEYNRRVAEAIRLKEEEEQAAQEAAAAAAEAAAAPAV